MVTIVDDLDSLTLQEPIFKDVKYYVSGDVSERVSFCIQYFSVLRLCVVISRQYNEESCLNYRLCSYFSPVERRVQNISLTMSHI